MPEFPEIKGLLSSSSRILLVCNKNQQNLDYLAAASSFFYSLKKTGKIVNCEPKGLIAQFSTLAFPLNDIKGFVLTINNNSGIISDIYYQKSPKEVKLFFTLTEGEVKTNDIQFTALENTKDEELSSIITLGVDSLDSLGEFYEKNFKFFFQKPILNVDTNPKNQEFGKINLIEEKSSFSGLLTNLLKSINKEVIDKEMATNLFLGILDFYKGKEIDKRALRTLIYLRDRGAKMKKIIELASKNRSKQEQELIRLIFKNLELNKKLSLPTISLENRELTKIKAQDKDLLSGIKNLRGNLLFLPSFLLLWEAHSSVPFIRGIFYSPNKRQNQTIAKFFQGKIKGNGILFSTKIPQLAAARKKILNLLGN